MELRAYLPPYYENSPEMQALQRAMQPEIHRLQAEEESIVDQLWVDTATWGLDLWERALGLPNQAAKPPEYRRARVCSKLRAQGTTTKAMLENVARSFSNGQVQVEEFPAENRFVVAFNGTKDVPLMDGLDDAIDEIKPAHLIYHYVVAFLHAVLHHQHRLKYSQMKFASCFSNIQGGTPVVLNGHRCLDGDFLLNQTFIGPALVDFGAQIGLRHAQNFGGRITIDSLYTLDGAVCLNGSRRLNAAILQEEIT